MSLVAYGSSDDSNDESENESEVVQTAPIAATPEISKKERETENETELDTEEQSESSLFSVLPKPKTQIHISGDDDKFSSLLLNKSQGASKLGKEPVKISIPALSDFENDEESVPAAKKFKPSGKGSGLMSLLPPPKNTFGAGSKKSLVPDSVKKTQVKPVVPPPIPIQRKAPVPVVQDIADDVGDEELTGNQFFSFPSRAPNMAMENNAGQSSQTNVASWSMQDSNPAVQPLGMSHSEYSMQNQLVANEEDQEGEGVEKNDYIAFQNNSLELDEKALQILCGNKKKRQHIPMNIIDLRSEEIMPDSKEWLMKQLTEEKNNRGHSHRKSGGPSTQSRRKHQITYLAYQAKAQELELQNQWANNRMSRKQTQSKYGF